MLQNTNHSSLQIPALQASRQAEIEYEICIIFFYIDKSIALFSDSSDLYSNDEGERDEERRHRSTMEEKSQCPSPIESK